MSVDVELNSFISLLNAVVRGNVDEVKRLLEGDDSLVYNKDEWGRTALHLAVELGKPEITAILLDHADYELDNKYRQETRLAYQQDLQGRTALHLAVEFERFNIIDILLFKYAYFELVYQQDLQGRTALHLAVEFDRLKIIDNLLFKYADFELVDTFSGIRLVYRQDLQKRTALHLAVEFDRLKITGTLLLYADLKLDDKYGETRLVCRQDLQGRTALHLAVELGRLEITDILLKQTKFKADTKDKYGNTAFQIAINNFNVNAIKQFIKVDKERLDSVADRDKLYSVYNQKGNPPLFYLIDKFPALVKLILDQKITLKKPSVKSISKFKLKVHVDFTILTSSIKPIEDQVWKTISKHVPGAFKSHRYRPMLDMAEKMEIQLLVHPVVEQFLMKKWRGYGYYYYVIMTIFYLVFLGSLIVYELTAIRPQILDNDIWYPTHMENSSYKCEDYPTDHGCMTEKAQYCINAGYLVLVMAICKLIMEVMELLLCICGTQVYYKYSKIKGYQRYLGFLNYFMDLDNLLQLVLYSTSTYFVSDVLYPMSVMEGVKWMVGILSIMAACVELLSTLRMLKKFNIGQQIIMFYRIAQTFVTGILFLLMFSIAAFILIFQMIFSQYGDFGVLNLNTIYGIIVRWTSGYAAEDFKDTSEVWEHWVSFLCILLSIVLVQIICFNLATGLAFEDVAKVRQEAVAENNALRILHVYKFADLHEMITRPLRIWCIPNYNKDCHYSFLTSHLEGDQYSNKDHTGENQDDAPKKDLSIEVYDIEEFVIFDEFNADEMVQKMYQFTNEDGSSQ